MLLWVSFTPHMHTPCRRSQLLIQTRAAQLRQQHRALTTVSASHDVRQRLVSSLPGVYMMAPCVCVVGRGSGGSVALMGSRRSGLKGSDDGDDKETLTKMSVNHIMSFLFLSIMSKQLLFMCSDYRISFNSALSRV